MTQWLPLALVGAFLVAIAFAVLGRVDASECVRTCDGHVAYYSVDKCMCDAMDASRVAHLRGLIDNNTVRIDRWSERVCE